jgi:chromosome segregation ATPase
MPDQNGGWFTPAELRDVARGIQALRQALRERTGETVAQLQLINALSGLVGAVTSGADAAKLAARIDDLLQIPDEIERVYRDLVEGAEAQAREFGEELEELRATLEGAPPPSGPSRQVLEKELERRFAEELRVRETLEEIEAMLAANKEARAQNEQLIATNPSTLRELQSEQEILRDRIAGGEATREDIVSGLDANSEKMRLIRIYLDALATLERGLPEGILGEVFNIIAPEKS